MRNSKTPGQNYSKYLFAGVLLAAVVLIFFSLTNNNSYEVSENKSITRLWSANTDSLFVKDCYNKYKPQVKDDLVKQETMKLFCRCMLEKVKSQYDETELGKVKDNEIKNWDKECRDKIINSNFLK